MEAFGLKGMTDLDLQDALMAELERMVEGDELTWSNGTEWRKPHVFKQDKPYKYDTDPYDQEDYVIVMLDDEDEREDGEWVVTVAFIVDIWFVDEDRQGNVKLADLMNRIYYHFKENHFTDGRYVMGTGAKKRFNQEAFPEHYEGALITKWRLPETEPIGIRQFLA